MDQRNAENQAKIDALVDDKIDKKIYEDKIPAEEKVTLLKANISEKLEKEKGQRHINLIWEVTQAIIAISVTIAIIYSTLSAIASIQLNNAFTLILALYFVRTNHTKIGGPGGTDSSANSR